MLHSYFKIALRNLVRQKGYTLINIAGLSIGLAGCFLILLFVLNELRYDHIHENADRIYRVIADNKTFGFVEPNSPFLLAPAVLSEIPEVEKAARVDYLLVKVKEGDQYERVRNFLSADPEIFQIFTLPLVAGDPTIALKDPNGVIITREIAAQKFGTADPMGKIISIQAGQAERDLVVTGVLRDIPEHSTFHASYIANMELSRWAFSSTRPNPDMYDNWMISQFNTYLLTRPGTQHKVLDEKLRSLSERHKTEYLDVTFWPQPILDAYLHSEGFANNHRFPTGNAGFVRIFSIVSVLILLIATLNHVILFTAQSIKRNKEVGVRKVVGAHRSDLIKQILVETLLVGLV